MLSLAGLQLVRLTPTFLAVVGGLERAGVDSVAVASQHAVSWLPPSLRVSARAWPTPQGTTTTRGGPCRVQHVWTPSWPHATLALKPLCRALENGGCCQASHLMLVLSELDCTKLTFDALQQLSTSIRKLDTHSEWHISHDCAMLPSSQSTQRHSMSRD
jgi:hypothetical protein